MQNFFIKLIMTIKHLNQKIDIDFKLIQESLRSFQQLDSNDQEVNQSVFKYIF